MWRDGIECFWDMLHEMRMLIEFGRQEESGPVFSIAWIEILGRFDWFNLESSCHSCHR